MMEVTVDSIDSRAKEISGRVKEILREYDLHSVRLTLIFNDPKKEDHNGAELVANSMMLGCTICQAHFMAELVVDMDEDDRKVFFTCLRELLECNKKMSVQ